MLGALYITVNPLKRPAVHMEVEDGGPLIFEFILKVQFTSNCARVINDEILAVVSGDSCSNLISDGHSLRHS